MYSSLFRCLLFYVSHVKFLPRMSGGFMVHPPRLCVIAGGKEWLDRTTFVYRLLEKK
jgi:hypothetical protein